MVDPAPLALARAQTSFSARSKMLDMYAGEIASMLADGRHDKAQQDALNIPHIAVALADAALRSSGESYLSWCGRWVQPDYGMPVYQEWHARSSECVNGEQDIPFAALRALLN